MIQISFLGAMATVGASGVLVDTGSEKMVLDYGTKIQSEGRRDKLPPQYPLPVNGKVDAVFLSHCHLDHSGGVPILFKNNNCPAYAVDVAKPMAEMLLNDSLKVSKQEGHMLPFSKNDVKKTLNSMRSVRYREPIRVHNSTVTNFDAGHIPGSMMTLIESQKKRVMYTGDFNNNDTRLIKGADMKLPHLDALITECTYSDREHGDRKREEKNLANLVDHTVSNEGVAVIPCFAVGRSQEILLILDKFGIDYSLYMDGMTKMATTYINKYNNRLNNPKALDKALQNVKYVSSQNERKRIVKQPCVIITTSGMLTGGPVAWYIKDLHDNRDCTLILTGYQVEGTPGRELMETGRYVAEGVNMDLKMMVQRLDFSSHIGRSHLIDFIEKNNPGKVFCVHGDHTEEFARELREKGFDAHAPVANNRFFQV